VKNLDLIAAGVAAVLVEHHVVVASDHLVAVAVLIQNKSF
jgi:hypothetical protein